MRLTMTLLIALLWSLPAVGDEEDTTVDGIITTSDFASTVAYKDPYRNLPCGVGPHTVYNLLWVECDPEVFDQRAGFKIDGHAICEVVQRYEWTDWPRCGGYRLPVIELGHRVKETE